MKKLVALLLVMVMGMSLLVGCGGSNKENANAEKDSITKTDLEQESESNTAEKEESNNVVTSLEIDGDSYQMELAVSNFVDNGWEIESYSDVFESSRATCSLIRGDVKLNVELQGDAGSKLESGSIDMLYVYNEDGYADVKLADAIMVNMSQDELISQLNTLGFEDVESYDAGSRIVVVAYMNTDEISYGLEFSITNGAVSSFIISE